MIAEPRETDRLVLRPAGGDGLAWTVAERRSGREIGFAGVTRRLELRCDVEAEYLTEAVNAVVAAAFEAGLPRLTAGGGLERLGFFGDGGRHVCLLSGMSADDVLEATGALAGLRFWLDGGWGVDALLGGPTRRHHDLDLALDEADLPEVERRLRDLAYEEVEEGWVGRPTRVVFTDGRGRWLDVHPLRFDDAGDGWQTLADGGLGSYPAAELVSGEIGGRAVPCISAKLQIRHHRGYFLGPRDRADLAHLRRHVR